MEFAHHVLLGLIALMTWVLVLHAHSFHSELALICLFLVLARVIFVQLINFTWAVQTVLVVFVVLIVLLEIIVMVKHKYHAHQTHFHFQVQLNAYHVHPVQMSYL